MIESQNLIGFPGTDALPLNTTHSWGAFNEGSARRLFCIEPGEACGVIAYEAVSGQDLVICQGDKALCAQWVKRVYGDKLHERDFAIETTGKACCISDLSPDAVLIWMQVPAAENAVYVFGLMAHEAVHWAFAIAHHMGIRPSFDNEEFFAYQTQFVMRQYLGCIGYPIPITES